MGKHRCIIVWLMTMKYIFSRLLNIILNTRVGVLIKIHALPTLSLRIVKLHLRFQLGASSRLSPTVTTRGLLIFPRAFLIKCPWVMIRGLGCFTRKDLSRSKSPAYFRSTKHGVKNIKSEIPFLFNFLFPSYFF